MRCKGRHKRISIARSPQIEMPAKLNECWTMDFVSDQLYNGNRFRTLTLIDIFSRECLDIYADKSITVLFRGAGHSYAVDLCGALG